MLELTGFLGLTRISFFLLPQIPRYCFVGDNLTDALHQFAPKPHTDSTDSTKN